MENTEKQPTTIGEWFDWADAKGYEWAKEAKEETVKDEGEKGLNKPKDSHTEALIDAFYWAKSEKGNEYWYETYERLGGKV